MGNKSKDKKAKDKVSLELVAPPLSLVNAYDLAGSACGTVYVWVCVLSR